MKRIKIILLGILLGSCSSVNRVDGWYPVDDSNKIEGEAIVTTADFESVSLDTLTSTEVAFIEGTLKQDRITDWTDATERRIGKRIGFVFNDSVVMAPTVNCRLESGRFTINSYDKKLILDIYNSLNCKKIKKVANMPQISYSTAPGMTMMIVETERIVSPIDSLVVEFTNSRTDEGMTGEWFKIERLCEDGSWSELPLDRKYANTSGEISIVFSMVGYFVFPDKPLRMSVKPWFYQEDWHPGKYRLVKTFHFPPYPIEKCDTAYVEFEIL